MPVSAKVPPAARPDAGFFDELKAAVARIEQRQIVHEQVAHRVIDMLAIHNGKLDAILAAATQEPGPSPVLGVLADILESLRAQESLLAELPGTLAETIRDEWRAELDTESEPGADDGGLEPAAQDRFHGPIHKRL